MNKLQTTMGSMEEALADVPDAPTAWVPLRRATVEEALRLLGGIPVALSILGALEQATGEVPAFPAPTGWRKPVLSAEEAAAQTVVASGTITGKSGAHSALNGHSPAPVTNGDRPNNSWRRRPKGERLALVYAEIARQAGDRVWLTQAEFDRDKPSSMPSASSMVSTLGLTWINLVSAALPRAVVPAAQPGRHGRPPVAKEPAAPAAEPFREAAAEG